MGWSTHIAIEAADLDHSVTVSLADNLCTSNPAAEVLRFQGALIPG
jgi:hypothetical protein